MVRVVEARPLHDFVVHVRFSDGSGRNIDLSRFFRGPVFEPLRDRREFLRLAVDTQLGTIVWPNGADICPDVLFHERAIVD